MSFGGALVDAIGMTTDRPHRSMLVGIFGNALGYDHADAASLQRLQERLRFAVRQDRAGVLLRDYQTISFGQPQLPVGDWTTRGVIEERKNADKKSGTHERERYYLADAEYVIALRLLAESEAPTIDDLAQALRRPARALFIGRACNLPTRPLFESIVHAQSLHAVLCEVPFVPRGEGRFAPHAGSGLDAFFHSDLSATGPEARGDDRDEREVLRAWWSPGDGPDAGAIAHAVTEDRDWRNQIVVGRRTVYEGTVRAPIARSSARTAQRLEARS